YRLSLSKASMAEDPGKAGSGEGERTAENACHNRLDDSETGNLRKRLRQGTETPSTGSTPSSTPPKLVSAEELIEAEKGVCKLALAHEIVVDESFRIKQRDPAEGSFEKTVGDIVKKAFWDCLQAQLSEEPPVYDHAIHLLSEIKESLLSFLLPGHTRLRNQINEVLDLDLIKQEAENGALEIPRLVDFIIGMMGTLCAPVRDEEIKKIRDICDVVVLFREIFGVLDLMKLDMVNFTISSIRPHLMQQSVEYERKRFQQLFDKQLNGLEITTKWLQEAASDVLSADSESAVGAGAPAAEIPATSVLNHAYLTLLRWDHAGRLFPETVLMDQTRFQEMQMELNQLTIIAAVLLVTYNMTGVAISGLSGFLDKLKKIIKVLLTGMHTPSFQLSEALVSVSEQICVEVTNCLSQHGFTPLTVERKGVLKGQIQAISNLDNSVRKLIDSRIQTFLKTYLVSINPKTITAPGGLGPIGTELEELTVKFTRLINYNRLVFSPYYDTVLTKILKGTDSEVPGISEKEQLSSQG
uniref:T-complex 11 like 1 n=2 Tax=Callorhinchus milii TaxID=7868 RepID=A0A4W3KD02_CALMI